MSSLYIFLHYLLRHGKSFVAKFCLIPPIKGFGTLGDMHGMFPIVCYIFALYVSHNNSCTAQHCYLRGLLELQFNYLIKDLDWNGVVFIN